MFQHEPPPTNNTDWSTLSSRTATHTRRSGTIEPNVIHDLTTQVPRDLLRRRVRRKGEVHVLQVDVVAGLDCAALQGRHVARRGRTRQASDRNVVNLHLRVGAVGRRAAAFERSALANGHGCAAEGRGGQGGHCHV